jgi:hypothetical protein
MAADTLLHVVCHNDTCARKDQVRTVRMPYLGDGVFARPQVVCECNPTVEMRYATTNRDGMIWDELELFSNGGHLVPAIPEPTEPPC